MTAFAFSAPDHGSIAVRGDVTGVLWTSTGQAENVWIDLRNADTVREEIEERFDGCATTDLAIPRQRKLGSLPSHVRTLALRTEAATPCRSTVLTFLPVYPRVTGAGGGRHWREGQYRVLGVGDAPLRWGGSALLRHSSPQRSAPL